MTFEEVLSQIQDLLQREKRVSYVTGQRLAALTERAGGKTSEARILSAGALRVKNS